MTLRALRTAAVVLLAGTLAAAGAVADAAPANADAVDPSWQVDQSTGSGGLCIAYDTQVDAQTFTAGVTGVLTAVDLRTWFSSAIANAPASVVIQIESVAPDGTPSGTVLGQGSSARPVSGPVTMSTPIPIVRGTRYAVMLPANVGICPILADSYAGGQWLDVYQGAWRVRNGDVQLTTYVVPRATVSAASAATSMETAVQIPLTVTPTSSVTLSTTSPPTHGSVSFSGTMATYTPAAGFAGPDSFGYQAVNAAGASDPAIVTVNVQRPTLAVAPAQIVVGTDVTVSGTGFPAGSTQDLTLHSAPTALGSVTVLANGTFTQVVRIPAGTAPGAHTITASGPGVAADPAVLSVVAATAPASTLAATGVDAIPTALGGLLLALLGIGILTEARARRRDASR